MKTVCTLEVDRDVKSVLSIDGNYDSEKEYMLASGVFSSAMEHRIFEQMILKKAMAIFATRN